MHWEIWWYSAANLDFSNGSYAHLRREDNRLAICTTNLIDRKREKLNIMKVINLIIERELLTVPTLERVNVPPVISSVPSFP
jgi:hypothetical protein